jgi:hypothetical protein
MVTGRDEIWREEDGDEYGTDDELEDVVAAVLSEGGDVAGTAYKLRETASANLPSDGVWEDLSVSGWYLVRNGVWEDIRAVNGVFTNLTTNIQYSGYDEALAAAQAANAKPFFSAGVCYMVGHHDTQVCAGATQPTQVSLTAKPAEPESESDDNGGAPLVTFFGDDDEW